MSEISVLERKIQHFNTEFLSYISRFNTSTLPTTTDYTYLMQGVCDNLSGVLAVQKLHSGGELPLDSLSQAHLPGSSPGRIQGYPKRDGISN